MGKLSQKLTGLFSSLILFVVPLSFIGHSAANGYGSFDIGSLLAYSNNQRAAAGEGYLNLNGALDSAAQAKANDMVSENYWGHYSPSGASPWTFISNAGYGYSAAGENLAYGFASSADVITAWMNSAEHRANLLNGGFVDVGFGIANSPNYVGTGPETIVVAEYGTPLYTPPPAPAYTAPAAPTSSTPAASSTPAQVDTSAPDTATADTTTQPTDTAPAPAPAAATPISTPPEPAKPVQSTAAKPKKVQSTWVTQLRDGQLAKNAKLNLTAQKVSDNFALTGVAAATALAFIGYAVLPTRMR
ncbi:MAG TPA: CAP domain-containing protein [Candidatus Saccharimonadales bacterium]|nr:CAP domain-containing protein [Candidatus Saccharimonadales bacterium]